MIGGVILVVVLAAFAIALRSESGARRVGELAQRLMNWFMRLIRRAPRPGVANAVVQFREDSLELLRARWLLLTVTTLAGHLTVWLVLVACLHVVGVTTDEVSLLESFAAWALVRLLTAIPITPGGLGVVELGLTGTLVGFGGARDQVVAAVLLYRALTFLPPLPLGLLAGLTFRRAHPGRSRRGRGRHLTAARPGAATLSAMPAAPVLDTRPGPARTRSARRCRTTEPSRGCPRAPAATCR